MRERAPWWPIDPLYLVGFFLCGPAASVVLCAAFVLMVRPIGADHNEAEEARLRPWFIFEAVRADAQRMAWVATARAGDVVLEAQPPPDAFDDGCGWLVRRPRAWPVLPDGPGGTWRGLSYALPDFSTRLSHAVVVADGDAGPVLQVVTTSFRCVDGAAEPFRVTVHEQQGDGIVRLPAEPVHVSSE